ncbi:MAG TPA: hypothetical protein VEG63_08475 [Candidatus Acidoferrales bacterium]|nr:hypothetical protein [Candidatus Acidoferrales bacterium]
MESPADPVSPAPSAREWRAALLLAAGLATLAILPIVFLGNVSGHDVEFHLPNWIDVARHWHEGVAYPHWSSGGHYGYGDPRFIIYPPFSWLLGGLLALVLPGAMLQGAYTWICVAVNALGAYRLAREWYSQRAALWAAAVYATNPYLILVYSHRCAYSELLASSFFLVAFLYATRAARPGHEGRRAALALAPAFACLWLSNVPAAVLGSYALGFVLLWMAIRERSPGPLVRGGLAMALGLGLAAFYILPIALEMSWIQSEGAFAGGLSLWNNFLFHRSDDADHTAFNLLVSALACGEMALAGAAFPIALRRLRSSEGQPGEPVSRGLPALCAVAALYAVMLFPWSEPLWRILPRIWMAEFPWRSLYILNIALALAIVAALRWAKRPILWAALAAVLWLGAGGTILSLVPWDPDEIHDLIEAAHSEQGYAGVVDEFLPVGVDPDTLDADAPRLMAIDATGEESEDSGVKTTVLLWNSEEKRFTAECAEPARLRLHLVNYRAWRATVNGASLVPPTDPDTGQMVILVPAGHSEVRVWFGHTPDRTLGPVVSLVALVVFLLAGRGARRRPAESLA